ncbi:unnamed protein product [Orchesella dallaii]|uniref:Secreted protein n=1 Tax=Orchesella dallaii TaxID=48710 RepID=A0ABP1R625_9HEXA
MWLNLLKITVVIFAVLGAIEYKLRSQIDDVIEDCIADFRPDESPMEVKKLYSCKLTGMQYLIVVHKIRQKRRSCKYSCDFYTKQNPLFRFLTGKNLTQECETPWCDLVRNFFAF